MSSVIKKDSLFPQKTSLKDHLLRTLGANAVLQTRGSLSVRIDALLLLLHVFHDFEEVVALILRNTS